MLYAGDTQENGTAAPSGRTPLHSALGNSSDTVNITTSDVGDGNRVLRGGAITPDGNYPDGVLIGVRVGVSSGLEVPVREFQARRGRRATSRNTSRIASATGTASTR